MDGWDDDTEEGRTIPEYEVCMLEILEGRWAAAQLKGNRLEKGARRGK